jgi:hypothetical protein
MCYATSNSISKGCRRARSNLLALCSHEVAEAITLSSAHSGTNHSMLAVSRMRRSAASANTMDHNLRASRRYLRSFTAHPDREEQGAANNLKASVAGLPLLRGRQNQRDLLGTFMAGYGALLSQISSRASELPFWALPRSFVEGCLQGVVRTFSSQFIEICTVRVSWV